ncbi:TonB-dependent copper receptor [Aliidiomarina taiwanensis]|uniref:TonB-dependent copper receptor n=1 Tax=Aliidiomarina taiwanensis TaxID=946228 RepID=A0A432X1R8_9GAMM|nr:TonB-dependent copper receptor [Aliidiomarina taiwanensis]RUO40444.1 TonB-dependent copper receptor [Aliidiomarina taiwanensis]
MVVRILYLTIPMLYVGSVVAAEPEETKEQSKQSFERIQVTGTVMQSPSVVVENTKVPRQPLPAHDGADYLKGITGFQVVRKGGASSDPVFRGLAGSRINILSDGMPLLGGCESRMDPPTAYVSPQSYDSIRVTKGPYNVASGPPAAAATVNFERNKPDFTEQPWHGFISMTGGSFGRAETNAELQTGTDEGYLRGNYTFARSDNYADGEGANVHSHYERWHAALVAGLYVTDKQELTLSVGLGDGESAYADRMMDGSSFYRENLSLVWQSQDVSTLIANMQGRVYYGYIDHIMDNYSLRNTSAVEAGVIMPAAHNPDRYTRGVSGRVRFEPWYSHDVEVGFDGMQSTHRDRMSMNVNMRPLPEQKRTTDAKIEQMGLYIEGQSRLSEAHRFYYGYRADRWRAEDLRSHLDMQQTQVNPTANEQREDTLHSGFMRFEVQKGSATYYAGAGQASRFPDYWEMIARGRESETSASALYIKPETLRQFDIGWMKDTTTQAGHDLRYAVSYFWNHIDDYILIEQTPSTELSRNIDAQIQGIEIDTKWQIRDVLQFTASLNYTRGKNKTDGLPLAQQAPLEMKFGASYQLSHWQLGAQVRAAQAQSRIAPQQGTIVGLDNTETSGYAVVALNASWHVNAQLQLHLGIDNVFDKQYAEHLSRNASTIAGYPSLMKVPEPGRSGWLYISYRL